VRNSSDRAHRTESRRLVEPSDQVRVVVAQAEPEHATDRLAAVVLVDSEVSLGLNEAGDERAYWVR
jgi:hypothetical protein